MKTVLLKKVKIVLSFVILFTVFSPLGAYAGNPTDAVCPSGSAPCCIGGTGSTVDECVYDGGELGCNAGSGCVPLS